VTSRSALGVLLLAAVGLAPIAGRVDPSAPAVEQRRQPVAAPAADAEYDRGLRTRVAQD
jgi:hypothetical protein